MAKAKKKENTHLVIKWKDIKLFLTEAEQNILKELVKKIDMQRAEFCQGVNKYIICNQDEPYAEKVRQIILDGEDEKAVKDEDKRKTN